MRISYLMYSLKNEYTDSFNLQNSFATESTLNMAMIANKLMSLLF